MSNTRWFGKLPCMGDFCSHNMPPPLQHALDEWLSCIMQQGQQLHEAQWMQGYFQACMLGFTLSQDLVPGLQGNCAMGVLMPSVDRAGRAYPFILLEEIPPKSFERLILANIFSWFSVAQACCTNALNENWLPTQLNQALECLPKPCASPLNGVQNLNTGEPALKSDAKQCHWYQLHAGNRVSAGLRFKGLPDIHGMATLLGMGTAS